MTLLYLDSSAWLKRYFQEPGSAWMMRRFESCGKKLLWKEDKNMAALDWS